jgi:glutamate--cysteine ligase catalytic subunit
MALSASTPLQHGYLTDVDTRWTMISQSVDCRNKVEREKGERYIGKSRYDSISYYIAEDDNKFFKNEYNDLKNYLDPEIREFIIQ